MFWNKSILLTKLYVSYSKNNIIVKNDYNLTDFYLKLLNCNLFLWCKDVLSLLQSSI